MPGLLVHYSQKIPLFYLVVLYYSIYFRSGKYEILSYFNNSDIPVMAGDIAPGHRLEKK